MPFLPRSSLLSLLFVPALPTILTMSHHLHIYLILGGGRGKRPSNFACFLLQEHQLHGARETVTFRTWCPDVEPGHAVCGWCLILICKWRAVPPLLAQVTQACIGSDPRRTISGSQAIPRPHSGKLAQGKRAPRPQTVMSRVRTQRQKLSRPGWGPKARS